MNLCSKRLSWANKTESETYRIIDKYPFQGGMPYRKSLAELSGYHFIKKYVLDFIWPNGEGEGS
jgi:hypothetical protein